MARLNPELQLSWQQRVGPEQGRTYPFFFAATSGDDVTVSIDGTAVPSTGWTIEIDVDRQRGNISLVDRPAEGQLVRIERNTLAERVTSFGRSGYARSAAVDLALNRLLYLIEELTDASQQAGQSRGHGLAGARIDPDTGEIVFVRDDATEVRISIAVEGGGILFTEALRARYQAAVDFLDAHLKGAALAASYEALPNRNQFSDQLLAKLNSVQANAQVNRPPLTSAQVAGLYESHDDVVRFTDALKRRLEALQTASGISEADARQVVETLASVANAELRRSILSLLMESAVRGPVADPWVAGVSKMAGSMLTAGQIIGWQFQDYDPVVVEASRLRALDPTTAGQSIAGGIALELTLNGIGSGTVLTMGRTSGYLPLLEFSADGSYMAQEVVFTARAVVPTRTIDGRIATWAQVASMATIPLPKLPAFVREAQSAGQVLTAINARVASWALAGNPAPAGAVNWTILAGRPAWTNVFDGTYDSLTMKPALFSGSYEDLTDTPTIPSTDGFQTEAEVDTRVGELVDAWVLQTATDATQRAELIRILSTAGAGKIPISALTQSLGVQTEEVDDEPELTAAVPSAGTLGFAVIGTGFTHSDGTVYTAGQFLVYDSVNLGWIDTQISQASFPDAVLTATPSSTGIRLDARGSATATLSAATLANAGLLLPTEKGNLLTAAEKGRIPSIARVAEFARIPSLAQIDRLPSQAEKDSLGRIPSQAQLDMVDAISQGRYKFVGIGTGAGQLNPATATIPFTAAEQKVNRIIHVSGAFSFGTAASVAFLGIFDVSEATWMLVINDSNRRLRLTAPGGDDASVINVQVGQTRLVARAGRVLVSLIRDPQTWNSIPGRPGWLTAPGNPGAWNQRWPTWNDVTGKPAQAVRWPAFSEVTGSLPYSRVTGGPVQQAGTVVLFNGDTNIPTSGPVVNIGLSQSYIPFTTIGIAIRMATNNITGFMERPRGNVPGMIVSVTGSGGTSGEQDGVRVSHVNNTTLGFTRIESSGQSTNVLAIIGRR